jgi:transcriptional regulator with XRE-family HTH domain
MSVMTKATRVNGSKIRKARLASGMSQAQLARKIGSTEKNISRWENTQNQPRLESVAAIAQATGRDIDFFLTASAEDDDEESAPLTSSEMDLYLTLHARLQRSLQRVREHEHA